MRIPKVVGLLPIIAYIALIGLGIYYDPQGNVTYNPPFLLMILNITFVTGTGVVVAALSARSYLRSGSVSILLLGGATLLAGLASLVAGYSADFVSGDYGVTTHNVGFLLSSVLQLLSAVASIEMIGPSRATNRQGTLVVTYSLIVLTVVAITAMTYSDNLPTFLGATGHTGIQQTVLLLTTTFFAVSGIIFFHQYLRSRSDPLSWYAFGLGMFAVGMVSLFFQETNGDVFSWIGGIAQYTGGFYFILAIMSLRAGSEDGAILSERWSNMFRYDRRQSADFFATMLNAFVYAKVLTDDDGKPVDLVPLDVNTAFERMTGKSRREVVGKRITESFPGSDGDVRRWLGIYSRSSKSETSKQFEDHLSVLDREVNVSAYIPHPGHIIAIFDDITDRKRAERALREERDRLSSLLNSMTDEVWFTDAQGKLVMVNEAVRREFGLPPWMVGVEIEELTPCYEVFRPDGTPRPSTEMPPLRALRGEVVRGMEEIVRTPATGQLRYRLVSTSPVRGEGGNIVGSVSVVRDITERKRAEEAAVRMASFPLLNPSPVVEVGADGTIQYTNPAAQEMFPDLTQLGMDHSFLAGLEQAIDDMRTRRVSTYRREVKVGGSWFQQQLVFSPQTHSVRVYSIGIDAIKEAEENLKRSNAELKQFAYVASHDLQEPLRMVTSYLDLLNHKYGDKLDPMAREYMTYVTDGAERMRELINDLLAYSRVETGGKSFSKVNMEAVAESVMRSLGTAITENKADLYIGPLPTILADETQMVQVLQNLLSNAVKFHGARKPLVKVNAEEHDSEWVFSVEDNGIGIDPMFGDKLFNMFQRLHTSDEYPGTGIGLAISKKIIERHGGRIWFESDGRNGTTFFFTIPKTANVRSSPG